MNRQKNLCRKNRNLRRHSDQRRHFERFDAAHEIDQQHAEHGRTHQRQRHPTKSLPGARAGGERRLLQRRIHVTERRGHQEKNQGIKMNRFRPDHAPHGINVERR